MSYGARFRTLLSSVAAIGLFAAIGSAACATETQASGRDVSQSGLVRVSPPTTSFADLIERVAPAVVSIDVELAASKQDAEFSHMQGSPFQFSPFGGNGEQGEDPSARPGGPDQAPGANGPARPKLRATGSGFFISPDGYIVTNNHVVEGATSITVRLSDKRQFAARLIGRDPATDLAVIKIDGADFSYVNFEDQAKPRVGDWVVAVGNPYDLGGTATAGIVSALRRENISGSSFVDYMQIDAPINRGNSGGPTFDVRGRVVGVNSAIFSPTGGSVGIGFAIPADIAQSVTRQLIANGKVSRGYIGATIQNVTPEIATSMGITADSGALVAEVEASGPAATAGLRMGDVILRVNGQAVGTASALTQQVALAHAGQDIDLTVLRDGKTLNLTARSGLRPSEAQLASGELNPGSEGAEAQGADVRVLGMQLGALSDQLRRHYGISDQNGVLVEGIGQGSDAQEKGVQPGDIIVKAGARSVRTPGDVSAAVTEARGQGRSDVLLLVSRQGRTLFVPVIVDPAKG